MSEGTKLNEPVQKLEWIVKEAEGLEISSHLYSSLEKAVKAILATESEAKSNDPENKWRETDNLMFLSSDENRELLDQYLSEGEMSSKLIEKLMDNFERDILAFRDTNKLDSPQVFSTIQSIYLGLGLKDAKSVEGQKIYRLAKARSMDDEIQSVVKNLEALPGCKYLADRFGE